MAKIAAFEKKNSISFNKYAVNWDAELFISLGAHFDADISGLETYFGILYRPFNQMI